MKEKFKNIEQIIDENIRTKNIWKIIVEKDSRNCPYLYYSFPYKKVICRKLTKIYKPKVCNYTECPIKVIK